jgi:nitrogen PTS system EIIA component
MSFGATLRLLRTDAGLTLRALAQAVGVSNAYLSRVENGHDAPPTPDRLVDIARVLRLPPALLVELAHGVTPFVSSYLERIPAANALFLEIARRNLGGAQVARLRAVLEAEFPETSLPLAELRLSAMLAPERVVLGLGCSDLIDAIDVAATRLAPRGTKPDAPEIAAQLARREQEAPSPLGGGIAIPHAMIPELAGRAALVTLCPPIDAATPDGGPLEVVVVLMLRSGEATELALLARVAKLAAPGIAKRLAASSDACDLVRHIELLGL